MRTTARFETFLQFTLGENTVWPVHMNLSDDFTAYQRRGVYVDGPRLSPKRPNATGAELRWLVRPIRGTGVRLLRLAERLDG